MFVVCGEALIDIFIEESTNAPNESFPLKAVVGGSPFNVAIGLARLGQPSALLTGISEDMFGRRLSAVLESEGVSQDLIVKSQLPTTVAFVEKDKNGVPTYSFYGEGTADRSLTEADTNLQEHLSVDMPMGIHLGSYSIVAQPTADSLLSLVKKYSGKCFISLDPNIRAIVEPDMQVWQKRVEELVTLADMVKVSDEDLELMYPDIEPEKILERWLATGLKLAVLTRGSEGSTLWSSKGNITVKTPKITVADTVGAGDTYQTALLDSVGLLVQENGSNWAEQLSVEKLQEIGTYAASAAAITCSRQGADLPTKSEIHQFMK